IVHDDIFNFLINTATEITARIKMQEDTKTVERGALWYEEGLPTETILSGIVVATPIQKSNPTTPPQNSNLTVEQVFNVINNIVKQTQTLQLGGNATVGRGMCRIQMVQEEQKNANRQSTNEG